MMRLQADTTHVRVTNCMHGAVGIAEIGLYLSRYGAFKNIEARIAAASRDLWLVAERGWVRVEELVVQDQDLEIEMRDLRDFLSRSSAPGCDTCLGEPMRWNAEREEYEPNPDGCPMCNARSRKQG